MEFFRPAEHYAGRIVQRVAIFCFSTSPIVSLAVFLKSHVVSAQFSRLIDPCSSRSEQCKREVSKSVS